MYGGGGGGGGGNKDEMGTRYRKEITCTCMLGMFMKSNEICVYNRHLDFKHHNAVK